MGNVADDVDAGGSGEGGEDQALGDQHADQADARRAEREADGDFLAAGGGAGEQQGGDVGAGDQQDEDEGAEEEDHQHEVAARHVEFELFEPRTVGGDDGGVAAGMEAVFLVLENVEFGLRLGAGDAGREPSGEREPEDVLVDEGVAAGVHVGLAGVRNPERGRSEPAGGEIGDDADDGDGPVVEADGAADDVGVGREARAPGLLG